MAEDKLTYDGTKETAIAIAARAGVEDAEKIKVNSRWKTFKLGDATVRPGDMVEFDGSDFAIVEGGGETSSAAEADVADGESKEAGEVAPVNNPDLANVLKDPIQLLDLFDGAVNDPRYFRNGALQQIAQMYRATCNGIKQHQARINSAIDRKAKMIDDDE